MGDMLPWRSVALVFRVVFAGVTVWGLALLTGIDRGEFHATSFLFFTGLSNLAVLGWAVASVIVTVRDIRTSGWRGASTPSARASGYFLMSIIVTMLIYLVLLTPTVPPENLFSTQDTLVHVAVPVFMIVEWALFTPKGRQRWYDPLLWALPPYAYLAWAFTHAALGGDFSGRAYPYPFMDIDAIGWDGFFMYLLVLTVGLEVVAFAIFGVDRLLGRLPRQFPAPSETVAA